MDKALEMGAVTIQPSTNFNPVGTGAMDFLRDLEFVRIRQKVDLIEAFTGCHQANRYEVSDVNERMFMTVTEDSETCERIICGSSRGFVLHLQDVSGMEIAQVHRRFKCCAGDCWCCGNTCPYELWVDTATGNRIAHIKQRSFCCNPRLEVLDGNDKPMFETEGPCVCFCQAPCCSADLEFPLVDTNGQPAGKITKIWDGTARACCTNANTFGCHFPRNLDVNKKLAILGLAFEIDFMFFESQDDGDN